MVVRRVENSELGILRVNNERPDRVRLNELPQRTRHEMTRSDDIFIFAKSAQRSRVHRPAYPDYIAVKKFNNKGEVVGERRFLGLTPPGSTTSGPTRFLCYVASSRVS